MAAEEAAGVLPDGTLAGTLRASAVAAGTTGNRRPAGDNRAGGAVARPP